MLKNIEGQKVPEVSFKIINNGSWTERSSNEIFSKKKVVVFALPGAFTPTCSTSHLPRYNQLAPVFFENGVDEIICLSVNDTFVMNAWEKDLNVSNISLLPDGNGEFSEGMGMLVDKTNLGFGKRSWRYSMLVEDGVITKMFIEEDVAGDPFKVSDADTMLNHINPKAKEPSSVTVFTKPGCPFCIEAKELLKKQNLSYEEIELGDGVSYSTIKDVSGKLTTPQVYIDGRHVGGLDELKKELS